jgi:hypothetical protein
MFVHLGRCHYPQVRFKVSVRRILGIGVKTYCIDAGTVESFTAVALDSKNWEQRIA